MPSLRVLLATAAVAAAVVLAGVATAVADSRPPSRWPPCTTTGPLPGLSEVQAQNARIVASTADGRLGAQAAVIAVMTTLTESGLRVLANPHDPSGSAHPSQGVGYDHDSLGLFQQRPSWGTSAARMDPVASTNLFLDALQAQPGWDARPSWEVAQDVQRSAFDGAPSPANGGSAVYGGNYLAQHARALQIVADITTNTPPGFECGAATTAEAPTATGSLGLPTSYRIPPQTSPPARLAVTFALAQLGKPYLWGGTGPDRFDCSGLTQAAWRAGGHKLGRTTWEQATDGAPASIGTIRPGDLVLTPGSDGSLAAPGHMGLYLGDGLVIHAPKSGDVVRVTALAGFVGKGLSGVRHIA
jgi:cell wall-associated NlpC family hydrolase